MYSNSKSLKYVILQKAIIMKMSMLPIIAFLPCTDVPQKKVFEYVCAQGVCMLRLVSLAK